VVFKGLLYPAAGEGSVWREGSGREHFVDFDLLSSGNSSYRRARARFRRYTVANDLCVFATLTLAEEMARQELVEAIQRLLRKLKHRCFRRQVLPVGPRPGGW
jgi:hypothetical protein